MECVRRYIASGQGGHNSDVIVWSFETGAILFRLSEHDHGVAFVDFSHDDRLLCSGGGPEDKKILVWDMSNGCIVAIAQQDPASITVAAWGGMVRYGPMYILGDVHCIYVRVGVVELLRNCNLLW